MDRSRPEYEKRVNRVIDYIHAHLAEDLSLERLAQVAAYRWVNLVDVPGGKYAVSPFVGTPDTIRGAWEALYRSWLPGSGYQPDDRPCLEVYRSNPAVAGRPGTFRCELCIPVRLL